MCRGFSWVFLAFIFPWQLYGCDLTQVGHLLDLVSAQERTKAEGHSDSKLGRQAEAQALDSKYRSVPPEQTPGDRTAAILDLVEKGHLDLALDLIFYYVSVTNRRVELPGPCIERLTGFVVEQLNHENEVFRQVDGEAGNPILGMLTAQETHKLAAGHTRETNRYSLSFLGLYGSAAQLPVLRQWNVEGSLVVRDSGVDFVKRLERIIESRDRVEEIERTFPGTYEYRYDLL